MNKWLARILGMMIVAIVGLLFYDRWFNPPIPQGVVKTEENEGQVLTSLEIGGGGENRHLSRNQDGDLSAKPPEQGITLTSLQDMESDNGAPVPVLSNPQGAQNNLATATPSNVNVSQTANQAPQNTTGLRLESLAASQSPPAAEKAAVEKTAPQSAGNNKAWIQAGSFGEKANAERLADSIRSKNLPAVVEMANVNGKTYHRVYVGPIAENRVSDTLNSLSAMGVNARQVNR